MCYLKGDDHEKWTFKRSMNRDDGVDLIGGCAAWANIGESQFRYRDQEGGSGADGQYRRIWTRHVVAVSAMLSWLVFSRDTWFEMEQCRL
jgi:hypothetical protein